MNLFLTLAYLFFVGSTLGWVLELLFRRYISKANPEKKWINPGFCVGPYLPLYGTGLCILYLIASLGGRLDVSGIGGQLLTVVCMAACMTLIEYIAGAISLKISHVRLWDYSGEWGNIQGIICPKFSFFWALASAVYYFLIHPYILDALSWLSENLAFSFVIGFFFGVFVIDAVYSSHLLSKMKAFAEENQVIIKYENLKAHIRVAQEKAKEKTHFLLPFSSTHSLSEHMRAAQASMESRIRLKTGKGRDGKA